MKGDILYPLNTLKEKYPDIYTQQVAKYQGREGLLKQFIPILECLWNDVLHFSAIHPKDVKKALIKAGANKQLKLKCYQVKPNLLESEKTIIYFSGDIKEDRMKVKNFREYNPNELSKYSFVPEETKEYYEKCFSEGYKPLVFHKVAHILYKGSINTKDLDIVEV